jgi:hypothetical protein
MASQKVSMIFNVSTVPTDPAFAQTHTGGWSESFWRSSPLASDDPIVTRLVTARAAILPATAAITGLRFGLYDLTLNRLVPQGSNTGGTRRPGVATWKTDLPQASLQMTGKTDAGANTSHFNVRCIPDMFIVGGEYYPSASFVTAMANFSSTLINDGWCFLGRDLSKPLQRVSALALSVLDIGYINFATNNSYLRFYRAYDTGGNPVKGAYRIVSQDNLGKYTLAGISGNIAVVNSGFVREDLLKLFQFTNVSVSRAKVKKIGRPSEGYRGRASRRR